MANTQAMPPTQPHTFDIKSLLTTLQSNKLKEQDDLGSLIDPLEAEFINVVKPVMISCTKESIAVSINLKLKEATLLFIEWKRMDI